MAARMRRTDSSMRRFGEAAGVDGGFEAGHGGVGNGRHQQHVRARFDRAHGGFAGRIERGDAAHVHRVGDDQAAEFHFVAEKAGENIVRKRGRDVRVRLEGGHGEMAGHDGARRPPRWRRETATSSVLFEFAAVAGNGGEGEMRIDADVAVAGEMLGGGEGAVFFHAANKLRDVFGDDFWGSSPKERMLMMGLSGLLLTSASGAKIQCTPAARASSAIILPTV